MLFDPNIHDQLAPVPWDAEAAVGAIREIVVDTEDAFSEKDLWPQHPLLLDAKRRSGNVFVSYPLKTLYHGAAGVCWALHHLQEAGVVTLRRDYGAYMGWIHEQYLRAPDRINNQILPSFLIGASGILAVSHRLLPSALTADRLFESILATFGRRENDLMTGAPGGLMAARLMYQNTGDMRWRELGVRGIQSLLECWKRDESRQLWRWAYEDEDGTQGYVGASHGFAGAVYSLLRSSDLMTESQVSLVLARAAAIKKVALTERGRTNWPKFFDRGDLIGVNWCHGSVGMITSLAEVPVGYDSELDQLLVQAGQLTWDAGPYREDFPAGICHSTAGNGFAFLKLHQRTGDAIWLDRARAFASHALSQSRNVKANGGGRPYSLYMGDLGLAVYLLECLNASARWPALDCF